MYLQSLKYIENKGTSQEWSLEEFIVSEKNLLVGKNASGKTRVLNIINGLAQMLAGMPLARGASCTYDCEFKNKGKVYNYIVKLEEGKVLSENLNIDNRDVLSRQAGGIGRILAEKINNGEKLDFQSPTSELAAVVRRDELQHSFLEPLHNWSSSVRHYHFGSSLGKTSFAIFKEAFPKADEKDENAVVGLFKNGLKEFNSTFKEAIKNDMNSLGYQLKDVGICSPISLAIEGLPGDLQGLYVQEKDLPGITDQHSMSQGMFRALAIFIHINYFQMKKLATCVLLDDVGEGLDFDRSCKLIELLREKSLQSDMQIIMSTNDRYVMNKVPLKEWSIVQRKGNQVKILNYLNSKDKFDEFKFTGLSNFSFLELDFINEESKT